MAEQVRSKSRVALEAQVQSLEKQLRELRAQLDGTNIIHREVVQRLKEEIARLRSRMPSQEATLGR